MDGAQAPHPLLLPPSTLALLGGLAGLALPLQSTPRHLPRPYLPTPPLRGAQQPRPTPPSLVLLTRSLLKLVLVLLPLLVSLPTFCKQLHLA